jgi:two-component sensor histidine kinase
MSGTGRASLRTWLALLVAGALVPVLAFAGLALIWLARSYEGQVDRGQADTTRALTLAVEAEVRAWRAVLMTLAEARELGEGRFQEFDAVARAVAARYEGWVVVNDAAGQQRVNTLRPLGTPLPQTAAGAMVEAVFRDGQPRTDLVFGAVAQRHIISNSVPVFQDGRVVLCLSLNFGPERLARLLDAQRLPPTWVSAVVNGEHRVVARSPHRPDRAGQPVVEPLQRAFAARAQGLVETQLTDGRLGRVAFQQARELPWVVFVTLPVAEVQAAWHTPLLGFLVTGGLLGLFAVGLAVGVARRITHPIQTLTRASASMLRGEAAPGPAAAIAEVAQLQHALAEGAERVRAFNREREQAAEMLQRANAGLETQVAERTAALSRANADLEESNIRLERLTSEFQEANTHLEEATAELEQELEERQRAEAELQQALTHEQEALADNVTLIREVHHRVKNNLQMLCDLLYLQAEALPSPQAKDALCDAYGRVFAIARLHEQLYQSMARGQVHLPEYLGRLVAGIRDVWTAVPVALDAPQPVTLDVDRAIHAGLIVNELVTNAAKHAFSDGRPGAVTVRVRVVGSHLELSVADNGTGLPPGLDLEQARSLGLRIVHILARRLHATVTIENHSGTMFAIRFPLQAGPAIAPRPE